MPWRRELRTRPWRRAKESAPPLALAAVAAALSWLIAHRLLGHPQPFFAPIAAAISLSTSRIQRSRRIAQMVVGVLVGILIGELLASALGTSTGALALIVFLTMLLAVLSGIGLFGEGPMFANQAAASAILVVTLHRHGTGSERAIDALVGGAVALVLGVGLFPANPLSLLYDAERDVLRLLAGALMRCTRSSVQTLDVEELLSIGNEIHQQLAALARARATAHANVRVAPRRWRLRAVVDAENRRTARLHLLGSAALGLLRTAGMAERLLPSRLERTIGVLIDTLELLEVAERPWTEATRRQVASAVAALQQYAASEPGTTAGAILGAAAGDVAALTGLEQSKQPPVQTAIAGSRPPDA